MSQSREKNPYSRWSEPCVHRYSLHSTPTSDEEKVLQAHPPLLTSTHSHREKVIPICCICCEQCNGLKSSRRLAAINYKAFNLYECVIHLTKWQEKQDDKSRQLQETLQVYLISIQVEETTMNDKQATLLQHLSLISNVFEAAVQYMQSLQVSYLAAKRMFDMSHALLACQPSLNAKYTDNGFVSYHGQIEIEKEKRISNLQELMGCCSKNITLPKDTCALLDDHRDRRKDFFIASANFKDLLEDSRLSVSQMEKLQRQHDKILKNFQQSRLLLDKDLPKIITSRLEALRHFFHKIAEFFGDMSYNMHVVNLIEAISMNLCEIDLNTGKLVLDKQETSKEICQKCKVNRVDEK